MSNTRGYWTDQHGVRRCVAGRTTKPRLCEMHQEHHYCETCEGWYGVPHDGIHEGRNAHPRNLSHARQCACRPCREYVAEVASE